MHTPRAVAVSVPLFIPPAAFSEKFHSSAPTADELGVPAALAQFEEPLYLICSSRKHPERYVLPKGGIEKGETSEEAALREGWVRAFFTLRSSLADDIGTGRRSDLARQMCAFQPNFLPVTSAGFRGLHLLSLGPSIADKRPCKPHHKAEDVPRATYAFELCLVTKLEVDWPEKDERTRRWCTKSEVLQLVTWKDENVEGLGRVPAQPGELVALASGRLKQETLALQ